MEMRQRGFEIQEKKKKGGMKRYFGPSHLAKTWETGRIQKERKMD